MSPPRANADSSQWWQGVWGVVYVTLIIQGLMLWWVWDHHLVYGFGDSLAHMTIARRIWDSPNPGLSQFGTNWLPLPHLFFILPSLWEWGWSTGIGGSIVTIGCAVVTSASLFRIGKLSGLGNGGGWVIAVLVATNPSWSYVAAVPLTEPFLVATTCLTVAGLMRWAQTERPYSAGMTALFCGLPAATAVMTRYEGWAVVLFGGVAVAWVSWRRFGWGAVTRRQTIAFAAPPALCVFWWFIFNWSVFGSPLYFENSIYSSKAFFATQQSLGLLPGKGNVGYSFGLYGQTLIDVGGTALMAAAFVGLVVTFATWRGLRNEMWIILSGTGFFVVASIWAGQATINLPTSIPPGVFNTRFGVEALPFLAVAAAQCLRLVPERIQSNSKSLLRRGIAVFLVLIVPGGWFVGVANGTIPGTALTIREAEESQGYDPVRLAAAWLHKNATSGYILLDETVYTIMPLLGFDFHRVIITSSGSTYRRLLHDPTLVTWIAVQVGNRSDVVWQAMRREKVLGTLFQPVAAFSNYVIYKQQAPSTLLPADQLLPISPHGIQR